MPGSEQIPADLIQAGDEVLLPEIQNTFEFHSG
jgi:hypothetical protein